MNYLKKHWRGEYSLATSFWLNAFAINLVVQGIRVWLTTSEQIEHPVLAARVSLGFAILAIGVIYPWQIVGLWRATTRHIAEGKKRHWATLVQILIVLGAMGTYVRVDQDWPVYRDLFELALGERLYTDYQVTLNDDGTLIHLRGELGFGISRQVRQLLEANPRVRGIVLDSGGGRIYEGRELSRLILTNSLNTYSTDGCYSACALAFISGNDRYLARGANLAFHQYRTGLTSLAEIMDLNGEQQRDLAIYQRRGVSQAFIDRIFLASQDDLWYPTIEEMTAAGVIHGVVNPSTLIKVDYGDTSRDKIEATLFKASAFQALKRREPETYNAILDEMTVKVRAGASEMEIQGMVANYVQATAMKALPVTSDRALFSFIDAMVNLLTRLEAIDPILCLKNLYPDQFGPLDTSRFLTDQEVSPLLDAMALIIDEQNPAHPRQIDKQAGIQFINALRTEMGDDMNYLDTSALANRDDYSRACKAVIHFYQLATQKDQVKASNALRVAFSH